MAGAPTITGRAAVTAHLPGDGGACPGSAPTGNSGPSYGWYGCDDSSSLPDVFGNCLKPPGGRIVIERGVTGGTKEQPVVLCYEIRRFLQV
jgi:hypothetical protein